MIMQSVKFLLRWCLALVGMIVVLFEEVLWGWMGNLMRQLGRLPPIALLESWIRRLPPILALPLFIMPWLIMLPVKLAAVWLIATGKLIKGTALLIGGEAFGIAFLARLYELCRPALHRWPWFVIVERLFLRWSHWAHEIWADLPPVRAAKARFDEWTQDMKQRARAVRQGEKPPKL